METQTPQNPIVPTEPTQTEPAKTVTPELAKKPKRNKFWLYTVLFLVVAAGAAGAWYYLSLTSGDNTPPQLSLGGNKFQGSTITTAAQYSECDPKNTPAARTDLIDLTKGTYYVFTTEKMDLKDFEEAIYCSESGKKVQWEAAYYDNSDKKFLVGIGTGPWVGTKPLKNIYANEVFTLFLNGDVQIDHDVIKLVDEDDLKLTIDKDFRGWKLASSNNLIDIEDRITKIFIEKDGKFVETTIDKVSNNVAVWLKLKEATKGTTTSTTTTTTTTTTAPTSACGNGSVESGEQCDDGNSASPGCSATCTVENGYSCTGALSVCTLKCGNGTVEAGEQCDDGNSASPGCSTTCTLEPGYSCTAPAIGASVCTPIPAVCGDGNKISTEQCDDGNTTAGDGCSEICRGELGYTCTGTTPSVCAANAACGNGVIEGTETCDDRNTTSGDGCSSSCIIEEAWKCSGAPSVCTEACGNGILEEGEGCDDGVNNTDHPNGFHTYQCRLDCQPLRCGDGIVDNLKNEKCDDGNTNNNDGCLNGCTLPAVCGNGVKEGSEQCDDSNLIDGDGCSATCREELGYYCTDENGDPVACHTECGDGIIAGNEACDDGDTSSQDGCNTTCQIEPDACPGLNPPGFQFVVPEGWIFQDGECVPFTQTY